MLALLIFAIPIAVLGPAIASLAAFRAGFPKNTLKVEHNLLLPIGLPYILLFDGIQLYHAAKFYSETYAANQSLRHLFDAAISRLAAQPIDVALWFVSLYFVPILIAFFLSKLLKAIWIHSLSKNRNRFTSWAGRHIETALLHHMSRRTFFDPDEETLMIDVYTKDGFLFSGIYSDYFITSLGSVDGISMTVPIRHKLTYVVPGEKPVTDSYLFPHSGEMYFPVAECANYHFWKLSKQSLLISEMKSNHHPVVLTWHLLLKKSLPKLGIRVQLGRIGPEANKFSDDCIRLFARHHVTPEQIESKPQA